MGMKEFSRKTEWWREDGEIAADKKAKRMSEAYSDRDNHFQPGSTGVNLPAVMKKTNLSSGYADEGSGYDHDLDSLGKGSGKAHSKGTATKGVPSIKASEKKVVSKKPMFEEELPEEEGFEDEDMGGMDEDFGGDEMGGDDFGGEEGFEDGADDFDGEGTDSDDVSVTIDGETYRLVKDEADDLGGDEFGDDMDGEEGGDIGGEEDDVTQPKFESKRKSPNYDAILEKALKQVKESKQRSKLTEGKKKALVKHFAGMKKQAEAMHKKASKALKELFTGEYVLNKQGETGLDFSSVTGDKTFAVVDKASSGNQYSPTISKSPYEPDSSHKGGKTTHGKTVENKKRAYDKWLESMLNEGDDAGQDAKNFHDNDVLSTQLDGEEDNYANMPELINKSNEVISTTIAKQESRRPLPRKQEKAEVKFTSDEQEEDIRESLTENFSFKSLLEGKY